MDKQYITNNLNFAAAVLLTSKEVTILRVTRQPNNQIRKNYHLSPRDVVEKLYQDYIADDLKVSPQQLNFKIAAIRQMPAEGDI
jgi:hypothetical protein